MFHHSDCLSVEHIDPRKHKLICGLKNEFNEILADSTYNKSKNNRFVPYRVCEHPAPVNFGDVCEFLIEGCWMLCIFGGTEWCQEANRIGWSGTDGNREGKRIGGLKTGPINGKLFGAAALMATSREDRAKGGKITGNLMASRKSKEEHAEWGRAIASQRWECLVTGKITSAGSLTNWQRKRGIDTSLRRRIS